MIRTTYTVAELEVSEDIWTTIWSKLVDAGYEHCIDEDNGCIDMSGIALVMEKKVGKDE